MTCTHDVLWPSNILCVLVHTCVCVREREGEVGGVGGREVGREGVRVCVSVGIVHAHLCVCVRACTYSVYIVQVNVFTLVL